MNVTKRLTAADSAETLFESCPSCKELDTTTEDCLYIARKSRQGKLLPEKPDKSQATLILNCKWLFRDHISASNSPQCTCFGHTGRLFPLKHTGLKAGHFVRHISLDRSQTLNSRTDLRLRHWTEHMNHVRLQKSPNATSATVQTVRYTLRFTELCHLSTR